MNKSSFRKTCSGIYAESLDSMFPILALLENDRLPFLRKLLPKFEEYLSLSLPISLNESIRDSH